MVSNGLSSRRTTLKRPIVCKSRKPGDCGACDLTLTPPVQPIAPDGIENWFLRLDCDPDPTDTSFKMFVFGAFTPTLPLPDVEPNSDINFDLKSPSSPGVYRVKVVLINGNRCLHIEEVDVTVGP